MGPFLGPFLDTDLVAGVAAVKGIAVQVLLASFVCDAVPACFLSDTQQTPHTDTRGSCGIAVREWRRRRRRGSLDH